MRVRQNAVSAGDAAHSSLDGVVSGNSSVESSTPLHSSVRKESDSPWAPKDRSYEIKLANEIEELTNRRRGRRSSRRGREKARYTYHKEMREFISEIGSKYTNLEDYSPQDLKKRGGSFIKRFLSQRDILEHGGMNQETELQFCKSFVEWGYYLGSLYGDKFIPMGAEDFLEVVDVEGKLDPEKMGAILDRERATQLEISDSGRDNGTNLTSRFDLYIDYRISTKKSSPREAVPLREAAYRTLKEALAKYRINERNISAFLAPTLQHIDWSLKQGYKPRKELVKIGRTALAEISKEVEC